MDYFSNILVPLVSTEVPMTKILTLIGQLVEFEQGHTSAYGCESLIESLADAQKLVIDRFSEMNADALRDRTEEVNRLRTVVEWKEATIHDLQDELAAMRRERVQAKIDDGTLLAEAKQRLIDEGGDPERDKIPFIKILRLISGLGLKEAKDIVDAYYASQKEVVA